MQARQWVLVQSKRRLNPALTCRPPGLVHLYKRGALIGECVAVLVVQQCFLSNSVHSIGEITQAKGAWRTLVFMLSFILAVYSVEQLYEKTRCMSLLYYVKRESLLLTAHR